MSTLENRTKGARILKALRHYCDCCCHSGTEEAMHRQKTFLDAVEEDQKQSLPKTGIPRPGRLTPYYRSES